MNVNNTQSRILEAVRDCLLSDGYAALSTRKVAEKAGVPLSQIHYHFGSKDDLILSLLRKENEKALRRQEAMYSSELPLWRQWEIACDYLDRDLESGYVRVLQEMTAAGWSSGALGKEMREIYGGWSDLLTTVASRADERGMGLAGFKPEEIVALVTAAFIGSETLILIGMEDEKVPLRAALRKVGDLIRIAEEGSEHEG